MKERDASAASAKKHMDSVQKALDHSRGLVRRISAPLKRVQHSKWRGREPSRACAFARGGSPEQREVLPVASRAFRAEVRAAESAQQELRSELEVHAACDGTSMFHSSPNMMS